VKKFYVGVKGIVKDRTRGYIVLGKDYLSGEKWALPGGRIDSTDSIDETLLRELQEELPGISDIRIGGIIHARRLLIDIEEDTSLMLIYYHVEATLPAVIKLSKEHTGYALFNSVDDIPEGINTEVDDIYKTLLK
jgi:8-oxo-dGTP pyrophosphatase MutT (NUDIX family)